MKTFPFSSSAFFHIAAGISIIFCSLSLLIFAINSTPVAKAEAIDFSEAIKNAAPWDNDLRGAVGLGIVKDTAYFVIWGSPSNMFYKASLDNARDWYKDK